MPVAMRTCPISPVQKFDLPDHFHALQRQLLGSFETVAFFGGALRDYYTGLNKHRDIDVRARGVKKLRGHHPLQQFLSNNGIHAVSHPWDLSEAFTQATGLQARAFYKNDLGVRFICPWTNGIHSEELDISIRFETPEQLAAPVIGTVLQDPNVPFCAITFNEQGDIHAHADFEHDCSHRVYHIREEISFARKINCFGHFEKIRKKYPDLKLISDMKPLFDAGQAVHPAFYTGVKRLYETTMNIKDEVKGMAYCLKDALSQPSSPTLL